MYTFLIIIHVSVCLVLIAVILLQAGRGGGLSSLAGGGGQTSSILGTQTNAFMTRATEVCAILFVITSLSLGILSTHRGKSLLEKERLMQSLKTQLPAATTAPAAPSEGGPADTAPAPAVPAEPASQPAT